MIVDTPPVMAVTDASVVAHVVSGVVFVVGAEMTSRHGARRRSSSSRPRARNSSAPC